MSDLISVLVLRQGTYAAAIPLNHAAALKDSGVLSFGASLLERKMSEEIGVLLPDRRWSYDIPLINPLTKQWQR